MRIWGRILPGLVLASALFLGDPASHGAEPPWRASLAGPPKERARVLEAALRGKLSREEEGLARLALGAAYLASGAKNEAAAQWSHPSVATTPLFEYGLLWRARRWEEAGNPVAALPLWRDLFTAGGEPSFKEPAAEALAREAEGRKARAEAIPYLEALREARPKDADVMVRLVLSYFAAGLEEKGRGVAKVLWRDYPANARVAELFKEYSGLDGTLRSREGAELLARLRSLARADAWWRLERELPQLKGDAPETAAWRKFLQGRLEEGNRKFQNARMAFLAAAAGSPEPAGESLAALSRIFSECKASPADYRALERKMAIYKGPARAAVTAAMVQLMKAHFRADEEEQAQEIASAILAVDPSQEDAREILYKRAWTTWMGGDKPSALALFKALAEQAPADSEHHLSAQFSLLRLGLLPPTEAERAKEDLERASRYGYFGYRVRRRPPGAAGPVKVPFSARPTPVSGSHRQKGDLLASLGLLDEARREYTMASAIKPDPAIQWDIARLEASRGQDRRAITFARQAFPDAMGPAGGSLPPEVWQVLYPRPYAREIRAAATSRGLPYHLLCALIRQESGFDAEARSRSNAQGLAQLLPTTGRATARKHKLPAPKAGSFFDPSWNSAVGAAYFADMLEKFGGNVHLALAAYNAGPNRVDQWLARPGCPKDPEGFVESIPFRETRSYVRRILSGYWEYGRLYPSEAEAPSPALAPSLTP
jgi:soluble lytic murein transglycosylase-like protein